MHKDELVTDAEVDAAHSYISGLYPYAESKSEVRSMLEEAARARSAALSTLVEEQQVAVKALAWAESAGGVYEKSAHAKTCIGNYEAWYFRLFTDPPKDCYGWKAPFGGDVVADSYEAAKAAAQADYESRIRSALVDVPAVESEPDMLRLAVAAVLEADTEFRANMMPGWDGDPLSDELDGLRRIFEASPVRSAIAPAPAEETWQPMDTAPKDGKHCILAVQEGAFIYSVQGAFDGKQWNAVHREGVEPLCWMPNARLPSEFLPASFRSSPSQDGMAHGSTSSSKDITHYYCQAESAWDEADTRVSDTRKETDDEA